MSGKSMMDRQLEEATLGGLLLAPARLRELAISEEDFAWDRHRQVFAALADLVRESTIVDELLLANELERRNQWKGDADLLWLINLKASGAVTVGRYADRLRSLAIGRRIHEVLAKAVIELPAAADPTAFAAALAQSLRESASGASSGVVGWADVVGAVRADLEAQSRGETRMLESPWPALDQRTGGFAPGEFVCFCARPGEGKSILLHSQLSWSALTDGPVLLVSAEMNQVETGKRLLAILADHAGKRLPLQALRLAQLSTKQAEVLEWLTSETVGKALPLHLRTLKRETPSTIAAAAYEIKAKYGKLSALGVDYFQTVHGDGRRYANRNEELSDVAEGLKNLGGDLGCPVFTASQLSRRAGNPPPTLKDLREGGNLEGWVDFAAGIWCEHLGDDGLPVDNERKLLCLKHRNAPAGYAVDLLFDRGVPNLVDASMSPKGVAK